MSDSGVVTSGVSLLFLFASFSLATILLATTTGSSAKGCGGEGRSMIVFLSPPSAPLQISLRSKAGSSRLEVSPIR